MFTEVGVVMAYNKAKSPQISPHSSYQESNNAAPGQHQLPRKSLSNMFNKVIGLRALMKNNSRVLPSWVHSYS